MGRGIYFEEIIMYLILNNFKWGLFEEIIYSYEIIYKHFEIGIKFKL